MYVHNNHALNLRVKVDLEKFKTSEFLKSITY